MVGSSTQLTSNLSIVFLRKKTKCFRHSDNFLMKASNFVWIRETNYCRKSDLQMSNGHCRISKYLIFWQCVPIGFIMRPKIHASSFSKMTEANQILEGNLQLQFLRKRSQDMSLYCIEFWYLSTCRKIFF